MSGKIVFDQTRRIATPITRSSVLTISFNEVNFNFTNFYLYKITSLQYVLNFRTTVVTAMKFTISDQPQTIDALLRNCIGDFLGALTDPDLNVRRVALVAFNSAAHNKPSLIRDLLRGKFEF